MQSNFLMYNYKFVANERDQTVLPKLNGKTHKTSYIHSKNMKNGKFEVKLLVTRCLKKLSERLARPGKGILGH